MMELSILIIQSNYVHAAFHVALTLISSNDTVNYVAVSWCLFRSFPLADVVSVAQYILVVEKETGMSFKFLFSFNSFHSSYSMLQ